MAASNDNKVPNTQDPQLAVNRNFNCNAEDFFFPILDMSSYDNGTDKNYIQMHSLNFDHVDPLYGENPRTQVAELASITNNIYIKKTYLKAAIEEELVYDDPENVFCGFGFPRAILTIPSPIPINASTYLGTGDSKSPYNKISAVSAAEDFSILAYINNGRINTEIHDALIQLFQHYYGLWLKNGNLNFVSSGGQAPPVNGPSQPASATEVTPDGGNLTPDSTTFGSYADLRKGPFNKEMAPKAAMAGFAAVPVESQQFVYGPWVTYPDLQRHKIFPHLNNSQRISATENMIGASHVEVQLDFVPENYGGMYLLDQAASELIESETSYQQKFETGSLSIPGLPLFSLGDELSVHGSSLSYYVPLDQQYVGYGVMRKKTTVNTGPNITNISVQLNRSPETRYTFKTYSSRLNIFNKRNADNMRIAAQKQQKSRRDFFTQLNVLDKKLNKKLSMYSTFRDKFYSNNIRGEQSATSSASPVEVLVGNVYSYAGRITGSATGVYTTKRSNVGLFDPKEVPREMTSSYSLKSFMSLDGFYSPVSFFPTKWGHTIPYTKFERSKCPICNGSKKYKEIRFTPNGNGVQAEVELYCDYCEDNPFHKTSRKKVRSPKLPPFILASGLSVTVRESADGEPQNAVVYEYLADKNLIQNPKNFLKSLTGDDGLVNLITLNPVISISGAFRNTNANARDFCGHSIEVVGRGYVAPTNSLRVVEDIVDGAVVGAGLLGLSRLARNDDASPQILNKIVPKPFLDIDYNSYDFRNLMNHSPINKIHELNQRFFGFKGPMVMHGWGYDVDGFPVPNASGNPIATGQFKPHPVTGALWRTRSLDVMGSNDINSPDYGDIIVGQNMRWVVEPSSSSSSGGSSGSGTSSGGTSSGGSSGSGTSSGGTSSGGQYTDPYADDYIPGGPPSTQSLDSETFNASAIGGGGGRWTEPYREKEFMDGWGVRQDNWPVGPIDLRWDEPRRVWVASTDKKYDNVYITLEEDLILEKSSRHTYPARGFLDDIDFDKEPIPSGTRRVVFVKDRSGYTAPRGSKLFCEYDSNSGFYQPISKPNIICSGIIRQGLNAEIFANYAEPSTGAIQDVTKVNVKFVNNLNFELKPDHRAMFVYLEGAWNLMSIGRP